MKVMMCDTCRIVRECKPDKRGSFRMPRGWKKIGDQLLCGDCCGKAYSLRAITIPVAGPVDIDWPELRERLRTCFGSATRLSNWAMAELSRNDHVRKADMDKLPPKPKVYLYPGARQIAPEMDTDSLVSVLHAIEGKYSAIRYNLIWCGSVSLPTYRYPQPYPVRSQSWKLERVNNDQSWAVSVRLAGKRVLLRLAGGSNFRRQLAALEQLGKGTAHPCELALYEQRGSSGDHRPGTTGRDGGGQKTTSRLMCKIVLRMPVERTKDRAGVLFVTDSDDSLLVALNAKNDRLWTINADHVKQWMAEQRRRNQRLGEDRKRETRGGKNAMLSWQEAAAIKYRRRMNTASDQYSAQVVNYADRCKFAEIRFVATGGKYATDFPWAKLIGLIKQKAHARGMTFSQEDAHGDAQEAAEADHTESVGTGA